MFTTWPFVASCGNLRWLPQWRPSQGIYAGDVRNFNGHSITYDKRIVAKSLVFCVVFCGS